MSETNRRIVLAKHPAGAPKPEDFRLETAPRPAPKDGEFLVRTRWVSVDPMIRIFVSDRPFGGPAPLMSPGGLIHGAAIGEVIESRHPEYRQGELLEGRFGWQDYAVSQGANVRRVDPELAAPELALGVLGLPGFSAYAGLHATGPIAAGQTVLVSGAAGAVGSVAGPIAKARGARVVGIAKGEAKRRYLLDKLGYDAVVDRGEGPVAEGLAKTAPDGVDIYFDNVGGPLFAEILPLMRRQGRVIICGLMAQYDGAEPGPRDRLPAALDAIMGRSLTVRAFSNTDYEALRPAFLREVTPLVRSGALPAETHVMEGLERTPAAFASLFGEGVTGKLLVRV